MSHSDPTGALIMGFGGGLWAFFKGFKVFRQYKIVADIPPMHIRSVPMGLVSIHGWAESDQPVISPVSRTTCCFYKVEIDRWETRDRSGQWRHHCTDGDGIRFFLHDETGKILIDSYSAEYDLPEGVTRIVDGVKPSNANTSGSSDLELLQYIERAGAGPLLGKAEHWLATKHLDDPIKEQARQRGLHLIRTGLAYAREGRIPLDQIEKLGGAQAPLADPEKEKQRQIILEHVRQGGMLPFAEPHVAAASGRYRLRECWILPGHDYCITGTCMENQEASDSSDRVLISKGHNEKTFLITSKQGREATKTLAKRAWGMILGGAAVSLFCLVLLLVKFKMF